MEMRQVVLVTGASSGIGRAIASYLTMKELTVYGTSRNPHTVHNDILFHLLPMDVTDEASIEKAIAIIIKEEGKIDVLINNAGVGITGAIEETPSDEIDKVFSTNVYGPIMVIKKVLPYMRAQKSGLIINLSSIAGYMGLPYRGIYSATKAALIMLTEALRIELKDFGIQVTHVAPGDFATNISLRRYHTPIYENSPYEKAYSHTLDMINKNVRDGEDPKKLGLLLFEIIDTPFPDAQYNVGSFGQKLSVLLKRILSAEFFEKLLIRHHKL